MYSCDGLPPFPHSAPLPRLPTSIELIFSRMFSRPPPKTWPTRPLSGAWGASPAYRACPPCHHYRYCWIPPRPPLVVRPHSVPPPPRAAAPRRRRPAPGTAPKPRGAAVRGTGGTPSSSPVDPMTGGERTTGCTVGPFDSNGGRTGKGGGQLDSWLCWHIRIRPLLNPASPPAHAPASPLPPPPPH